MGLINTSLVLGKISQVLNEVYELKVEEQARSTELIKQLNALEDKVDKLSKKVGVIDRGVEMLCDSDHKQGYAITKLDIKLSSLHHKVGFCEADDGTLEGLLKNTATKTMVELLGKKVNEIGKTVNDHFESFVKVSEKDTELAKLMIEGLFGKKMDGEASAEPKLTEKRTKNEGQSTKGAASEAKKTFSETDGNGGETDGDGGEKNGSKSVVIRGKISINTKMGCFFFSEEIEKFLEENGFKYIPLPASGFKELSFRKTLRKGEKKRNFAEVGDGMVFDEFLAEDMEERYGDYFDCVLRCNSHYCKIKFKKRKAYENA